MVTLCETVIRRVRIPRTIQANILLTEQQLAERQQRSIKTLQNLRVKGGSIPVRQNRSARSLPPQRCDRMGSGAHAELDIGRGAWVMDLSNTSSGKIQET